MDYIFPQCNSYKNNSSSPDLRIFTADCLEEELKSSANIYLTKEVKCIKKGELMLPEIIQWYSSVIEGRFGKENLIVYILSHVSQDLAEKIRLA